MEHFETILSAEEINTALNIAAKSKEVMQNRIRYNEELRKEKVFNIRSYDQIDIEFREAYLLNEKNEFIETKWNKELFHELKLYFSNDPRFEECKYQEDREKVKKGDSKEYSFDKSIFIQGPVGSCKTSMLRAFQLIGFRGFRMKSTKKIVEAYDKGGFGAIEIFSMMKIDFAKRDSGWWFDDVGWEDQGKHFGKTIEVMEEIFESINNRKIWSHFPCTTNLTTEDFKERYGGRLSSRMKDMYNLMQYHPEAKDMRGLTKKELEEIRK